jgi:hypothetical protein
MARVVQHGARQPDEAGLAPLQDALRVLRLGDQAQSAGKASTAEY